MSATHPRILITGATGFVGQHLLEALRGKPYRLRLLSRKPTNKNDGNEWITGDLTDREMLRIALKDVDVVIHLAAELRDEKNMKAINTDATRVLGELALLHGIPKFIHLSSVGVSGYDWCGSSFVVNESTPCEPQNMYERTKRAGEEVLLQTLVPQGCKLTIIRPTNVFGDAHPRQALLRFLQHAKAGKRFFVTRNATANYVYVGDLVATLVQVLEKDPAQLIYQCGSSTSLAEFHALASKTLGVKPRQHFIPEWIFGLLRSMNFWGSNRLRGICNALSNQVTYSDERLKKEFVYPFGIEKGLEKTCEYYKREKLL
ncbi:MAG: NAD-dependent epimerase/dehydratase family protein [Bacteroidia bacterium]